jgi:hypothetical protein
MGMFGWVWGPAAISNRMPDRRPGIRVSGGGEAMVRAKLKT